MKETLAAGLIVVPAAVMFGHWCVKHLGTRGIERRLEILYRQVIACQVESIDRRMRDVEASAARAENEARMVSVQMAEMSDSLAGRIEQVEHRIELDVIAGRYRPGPRRRQSVEVAGVRR